MNFYGQWNPPVDQVLYENYFKDKRDGFFIECGAGSSGESCFFFERYLNWTDINIESSKYEFRNLDQFRLNSTNLNLGLSDKRSLLKFTDVISAPGGGNGNGSFFHKDWHKDLLLNKYECILEEYFVPTITYKDLIKLNKINHVDLFVLDVEGHELNVIDGMGENLPDVICIEYTISGLEEIKLKLIDKKYKFNFLSFNNAYFSFINKNKWFGETNEYSNL